MLNPDIRDQAYQFFIEEVPELLEAIENGLLGLREDRSTAKVHEVMRAAHSIKGGAASVELEVIKVIAHRLESIFKALYDETVEIDPTLESELLQAYDCLRLPLIEQIETGSIEIEQALAAAEPIFAHLEERLKDALAEADNYIPTSSDLGIDMVASIFEIDVAQGIDRLSAVLQQSEAYPIAGELQAQAEVFMGLAELLNLPGFGEIAEIALKALEVQPEDQALQVLQLALADFIVGRDAVLAGDRDRGGTPSLELIALTQPSPPVNHSNQTTLPISVEAPDLADMFGNRVHLDKVALDIADLDADLNIAIFNPELDPNVDPELADADDAVLDLADFNTDLLFDDAPNFLELMAPVENESDLQFAEPGSKPVAPTGTEASVEIATSNQSLSNSSLNEPELNGQISYLKDRFSNLEELLIDTESDKELVRLKDIALADTLIEDVFGNAEIWNESESFWPDEDGILANQTQASETQIGVLEAAFANNTADTNELVSSNTLLDSNIAIKDEIAIDNDITINSDVTIDTITVENAAFEFDAPIVESPPSIESLIESAEQLFDTLPSLASEDQAAQPETSQPAQSQPAQPQTEENKATWNQYLRPNQATSQSTPAAPVNLSVKVDVHRLERMNNLVGELAINRNSLALQNEQIQNSIKDLVNRFDRFQTMIGQLQELSDRMLVTPARCHSQVELVAAGSKAAASAVGTTSPAGNHLIDGFDALEMDRYSALHFELQDIFEQVMQIEESLSDLGLFTGQSNQTLSEQRQKMTQLQNELMWARMLPLGNVLNRFPRVLRDLSTKYNKLVGLKLSGTGVLVDKMALEKLYDPLLHLLRNAFDHGIELPEARQNQGKAKQGTIEIRAYHRGNQTLVEVIDDGKGLDLQRIGRRAVEMGWIPEELLETAKPSQIFDFIFEPGFSTAEQVSELSGRGVGLDVVRAQLRSLKGSVSVNSSPGKGTTFTLSIPLTLTVAKLLTCAVGPTTIAVPSDSIAEILVPRVEQLKQSGHQQFLHWREQVVPIYQMNQLLSYACVVPESSTSDMLTLTPTPKGWAAPMLVIQREQHSFAIEIDQIITEQELVIKPFGIALSPPPYTYGCTILGDGSLVPVVDLATLVDLMLEPDSETVSTRLHSPISSGRASGQTDSPAARQVKTILVVDDSATLRRMLALTLEKAGYRVLQGRDGLEAIKQLQQSASVQAVVCDIEMPNMNGFEFLSQRRQNPNFANIPVIMLTSRSNDKHRRLAMQLGATAYFSKPYIEHEMLAALKNLFISGVAIT
jgi:two-component system, chemotaxis family, sensor histidine kinase and response regulator PixL